MAQNSKIEWTTHTQNLWHGCTKVHEGCDNCYAETLSKRWGNDVWGNDKPRKEIKSVWNDLAKYQKLAKEANEMHRVFVGSMMDIFEKPMPLIDSKGLPVDTYDTGGLRNTLFQRITDNYYPNLMFLLLTKRPSNINKYIPECWKENPPDNVMFGTSPVNQETADNLIEHLLQVKGKKFLSCEPMLGEISLEKWIGYFGGECYICAKKYNEKRNGLTGTISGSIEQIIGDNPRRRDLENSKKGVGQVEKGGCIEKVQKGKGGTRHGGIFDDSVNVQPEEIDYGSAPINLLSLQWGYSERNDSQSQKREEERQPSRQLGVDDGQRASAPRQNSFKGGYKTAGWGKELDVEINQSAGIGNSSKEGERRAVKEDCTRLRDRVSACFEVGEGATLAKNFWVIQGGESGHNKRPFNLEWAYSMKRQCELFNIPYFFKQIDKIKEIPSDLQIRQFPVI